MQQYAPLLAGLRKSIVVIAILSALSAPQAGAVTIPMTSGSIHMDNTTPYIFNDVFVTLGGPDFALTNYFLHDSFFWTSNPNPAFFLWPPGTIVEYDGFVSLVSPNDLLVYGGVSYLPSGQIHVDTSSVAVGPLFLTVPFTLSGTIHGVSLSGPETVDLDIIGSGVVSAHYTEFQFPDGPHLRLESITYEIVPIPEPAMGLLLASGLAGFAARRKLARRMH
jgi:PEP-CTERM motif